MKRSLSSALTLTLALGLTQGCASTQNLHVGRTAAAIFISDDQEKQLGLQVKSDLDTKQKVVYVTDPTIVGYVNTVSTRILQQANKDRPGVKWTINVIDDPKTVNAFATPGGYLYVYTGLLLAADNEAEVAGVMGHESGHVVGRHSAQALMLQYGEQAVVDAALGKNPGTVSAMAASLAGNGASLAFSRDNEAEADEFGTRYMSAVGYDPHALMNFFQKLATEEGTQPSVLKWLSTHPPSAERVQHVNQVITQNNLTGKDLGADRLAPIKQRIKALPPVPTATTPTTPATQTPASTPTTPTTPASTSTNPATKSNLAAPKK